MYESVVEKDQYLISIVLILLLEAAVLIPMRDIFGVNDPLNKLSKELYVLLLACSALFLPGNLYLTLSLWLQTNNHLPLVYPYFIDV